MWKETGLKYANVDCYIGQNLRAHGPGLRTLIGGGGRGCPADESSLHKTATVDISQGKVIWSAP